MAEKEFLALRMLMDNARGLYGSELVRLSDGRLGRGTVYTLLDRLVQKGFVTEIEEAPSAKLHIARTRHKITGAGQRACQLWANDLGLSIKTGVFAQG